MNCERIVYELSKTNYYKKIKGVQNGFKSSSVVGTKFCESTKDKWLNKEVVKLIST